MALAQATVWVPGQVLTAAALNAEFQNILTNPISLISPTTGAVNFNLQAHTNLLPNAISASSGTASQAIVVSGTAAVWGSPAPGPYTSMTSGQMLVGTSSGNFLLLAVGTTGQVLTVSSSNTGPVWGVVPPSGGLTSATISTGAIFYLSTAGTLLPLTIGTSGQVLTVSTALLPSWAAAAGAAGGTVKAAVVFTSSGNIALSTTIATLGLTLSITPNTTAARLKLDAIGTHQVSPGTPSNSDVTDLQLNLDGVDLRSHQIYPIITASSGLYTESILLSMVTSVISTAAHTVSLSGFANLSGGTNTIIATSSSPLILSAFEVLTSG